MPASFYLFCIISFIIYLLLSTFSLLGTSAIVASSLLDELHWNESQLGRVQSAFFIGYALTQVFGGVLGGQRRKIRSSSPTDTETSSSSSSSSSSRHNSVGAENNNGSEEDDDDYYYYYGTTFTNSRRKDVEYNGKMLQQQLDDDDDVNTDSMTTTTSSTKQQHQQQQQDGRYRTILPLSLLLTGITTLLFPVAAKAGPNWAIFDRFALGLLEGVLLPAAMAGISATTTTTSSSSSADDDAILSSDDTTTTTTSTKDIKATASAIVISGCYLGSAWAYLTAWIIFSEPSQVQLVHWGILQEDSSSSTTISVWPLLFYINGILSLVITIMFSSEFDLIGWRSNNNNSSSGGGSSNNNNTTTKMYDESTATLWSSTTMVMMKVAAAIATETLSSKSGRAIIAAQIGQGALLYSIASWGPLYLERIATDVSTTTAAAVVDTSTSLSSSSFVSSTAVAASIAASSLIVPQITQALVGVSIGIGADKSSSNIGPRLTRRSLQFISGVGPAMILVYLAFLGSVSNSGVGVDARATIFQSPAFLFGAAQTISAISLGAVSVSHLEVAPPSKSGAVYALGNVFAAISGSITVTLFGILLDKDGQQAAATTTPTPASDFSLPFLVVAMLSAVGSIVYSLSIESDLDIGMQETNKHHQEKSK